jgi:glycosyltransferase involved in cell wall biosynthesis
MARILVITEASYLSTGYAGYGRELIPRLISAGHDVAELSIYGTYDHEKRKDITWKNYPNMPASHEQEDLQRYREKPANQFGAWRYFSLIYMPTVDASPQSEEWLHMFDSCDGLLTYSDWAGGVLKNQMGDIPYFGSAPFCDAKEFYPMARTDARDQLGIEDDCKIVGTVMRNQRRKLFDDLFVTFKNYLKLSGDKNTYLYCHTSYPDNGWPLGQYIIEQGLSSKVLLTYSCEECGHAFASFFSDAVRACAKCHKFAAKTSSVAKGISRDTLNAVYNSLDLYVQYHNSEGQGIPPWEAISCETPTAVINYSAPEDLINYCDVIPLKVKSTYREMETGCYRATPDNDANAQIIFDHLSQPAPMRDRLGVIQHNKRQDRYSWEKSAANWLKAVESTSPHLSWDAPPNIKQELQHEQFPAIHSNADFLEWCFAHYLGKPERVGSHQYNMILRDFNNGMFKPNPGGFFYSDASAFGRQEFRPFTKAIICDMMTSYVKQQNFWEKARTGQVQFREENWL